MAFDTLRRTMLFLAFALAQALVFNRIQLFNCATPLFYVYFVVMFPRNFPKWAILLWCFSLGLVVDMFANTPGVASASLTLVGALQPYLLEALLPREPDENHKSSAGAIGWGRFLLLTAILALLHCVLFFSLEFFSYFNWQHWLLCVGGSTALTTMLIMTFENFRTERQHQPTTTALPN